jgi:hypothetical protein
MDATRRFQKDRLPPVETSRLDKAQREQEDELGDSRWNSIHEGSHHFAQMPPINSVSFQLAVI